MVSLWTLGSYQAVTNVFPKKEISSIMADFGGILILEVRDSLPHRWQTSRQQNNHK